MSLGSVGYNFNSLNIQSGKLPEGSKRPEGFQGSGKDVFVRGESRECAEEMRFAKAGRLFQSSQGREAGKANEVGKSSDVEPEEVSMYPGRNGYDKSFLGVELPMPELGASIRDKVAMRKDKPGECELTYTNYSVVMNKERRQCFYAVCNIDGSSHRNVKRAGSWTIDGRIDRDYQLGNEAYSGNNIDKGHMVRRLDPCWGKNPDLASNDTFSYCNAALQHGGLNQKEWLALEDHVLGAARCGQKLTVITGPIFSENDPKFDNHGQINPPTQIPMKFFKTVVWKDSQSGGLKSASFVLSQEDIINKDGSLFKGRSREGLNPDRFEVYQVPLKQLEQMTDLHFGDIGDISKETVKLTAASDYKPYGL
ncbi:DNA/RNA non-specific endonuclease [bacterium]|nr:DNA/RNA non-specific endonuclease [bacterium]